MQHRFMDSTQNQLIWWTKDRIQLHALIDWAVYQLSEVMMVHKLIIIINLPLLYHWQGKDLFLLILLITI